jgi:hypothetical protein
MRQYFCQDCSRSYVTDNGNFSNICRNQTVVDLNLELAVNTLIPSQASICGIIDRLLHLAVLSKIKHLLKASKLFKINACLQLQLWLRF